MIITTVECDNKQDCIKACPTAAIQIKDGRAISCLTCGVCADVCPTKAIRKNKYGGYTVDYQRCTLCKLCELVCPITSIKIEDGKVNGICSMCGQCIKACPNKARVDGTRLLDQFTDEDRLSFVEKLSDLAIVEKKAKDLKAELEKEQVEVKTKSKRNLVIDTELCNLCGKCSWVCPLDSPVSTMDNEGCTDCGYCVEICPVNAIDLETHEIKAKCIRCLKCYEGCPRSAITISDEDGTLSIAKVNEGRKGSIAWCTSCGNCARACETGSLYERKTRIYHDPTKCDKDFACLYVCPTGVLRYDEKKELIRGNCVLCNICVSNCPQEAMKLIKTEWDGKPTDKCVGCGICVEVCPEEAIVLTTDNIMKVDLEKCTLCEKCASYCPYDAIPILKSVPKKKIIGGTISLNKSVCINCGLCIDLCPHEAINKDRDIDLDKCVHCGGCANICPVSCITVKRKFDDGLVLEVR